MVDFRPVSEKEIKLVVNQCKALPGYRAGIALSNEQRCRYYLDWVADILRDEDQVLKVWKYGIDLTNHSSILFFVPTDNTRGRKFHEIILDNGIDQNVVWNCLAYRFLPTHNAMEYQWRRSKR